MDSRLKHKVNVSYAEYRELEKSWMAARALVCGPARLLVSIRDLRPGLCAVADSSSCGAHHSAFDVGCLLQAENLEVEREELQQKVDCYEEARQVRVTLLEVGSPGAELHGAPGCVVAVLSICHAPAGRLGCYGGILCESQDRAAAVTGAA